MSVLEIEFSEGIALVRLNRPEARNALNPELIVALANCWIQLRDDDSVRVIVLTGAAGSTFCAGFDLGSYIPLLTGARQAADEWDRAVLAEPDLPARATLRDLDIGKPLIVAANGHAIAGGMEMLLAGDLRVVASGARLGLSEVKLGLIPAMGGTARLTRLVSPALAAASSSIAFARPPPTAPWPPVWSTMWLARKRSRRWPWNWPARSPPMHPWPYRPRARSCARQRI